MRAFRAPPAARIENQRWGYACRSEDGESLDAGSIPAISTNLVTQEVSESPETPQKCGVFFWCCGFAQWPHYVPRPKISRRPGRHEAATGQSAEWPFWACLAGQLCRKHVHFLDGRRLREQRTGVCH